MSLLKKLFGKKEILVLNDEQFGQMQGMRDVNSTIHWSAPTTFMGKSIQLTIKGTEHELDVQQKQLIINALKNEDVLKIQSEIGLKEQYENAGMKFKSLNEHFELEFITSDNNELTISFLEKKSCYIFNVHFEENTYVAVSIDG